MPKSMFGFTQAPTTHNQPPAARHRAWTCAGLLLALIASHALAQPLRIVTTTSMIADMVHAIVGDCVDVQPLIGPGIDPHLYRATAGDVDRLARAQWIVHHGLGLEGQLGNVLTRFSQRTPTLALADAINYAHPELIIMDAASNRPDPHVWLDAELWAHGVTILETHLRDLAPECTHLSARANAYTQALTQLHQWARQSINSIPESHRMLVTSHDAFAYFGRAYGMDVHGIEGISTESEASIGDIRATTDIILNLRLPAIFIETSLSPRTIEAVRAATQSAGHPVAIAGPLFGDAMGNPGTPEGTVIGMLRHNVLTMVRALGGEPATWPAELDPWLAAQAQP